MLSKVALRHDLRVVRQSFVNQQDIAFLNTTSNQQICGELLKRAICVAGYCAVGSEVNVDEMLGIAAKAGTATALPYLADRSALMEFRAWSPGEPLERAPFGFNQPISTAPCASPDLILLPLVGFDRAMNRLGQGAGHYDRALATHPEALRIGIAWSVQEVLELPSDPWDMPMDGVMTEKEWIIGANSRIGPL
jgi:5-formyltetrahydrofolate cyclo-ligase